MRSTYPGCTLQEFWKGPVIPVPANAGLSKTWQFEQGSLTFQFNRHGYRCREFDNIPDRYALVVGCSHTEGFGLEQDEIWPHRLEQIIDMPVYNIAKSGANAEFVKWNLLQWLKHITPKPTVIVAQWPNAHRFLNWVDLNAMFVVNCQDDPVYSAMLKHNSDTFWFGWISSVIAVDYFCQQISQPIIHMALETLNALRPMLPILADQGIDIHLDRKEPGQTWHFDSGAMDQQHHSGSCHRLWANRIKTIIDSQFT